MKNIFKRENNPIKRESNFGNRITSNIKNLISRRENTTPRPKEFNNNVEARNINEQNQRNFAINNNSIKLNQQQPDSELIQKINDLEKNLKLYIDDRINEIKGLKIDTKLNNNYLLETIISELDDFLVLCKKWDKKEILETINLIIELQQKGQLNNYCRHEKSGLPMPQHFKQNYPDIWEFCWDVKLLDLNTSMNIFVPLLAKEKIILFKRIDELIKQNS